MIANHTSLLNAAYGVNPGARSLSLGSPSRSPSTSLGSFGQLWIADRREWLAKVSVRLDRSHADRQGRNIWNHVNINDVGHLYGLVYIGALQGDIGHGKDGFYFATGGEFDTLSVVKVIGACLAERWWIKNSEPSSYTHEELLKYFSGFGVPVDFFGVNSRGVSQRSESIGWKPKYTELSDLLEGVRSEVVHVGQSYGLV